MKYSFKCSENAVSALFCGGGTQAITSRLREALPEAKGKGGRVQVGGNGVYHRSAICLHFRYLVMAIVILSATTASSKDVDEYSCIFLHTHEEIRKTKAENINDFILSDETIFEKIFGDLNNDGVDDCIIIIKQTKEEAFVSDEYFGNIDRNRRGILIAFKENDYYVLNTVNSDCFSSENEDGGVYFPPELHVGITQGNLIIGYGHGRYGSWEYIFRYQNNNFELIDYTRSEYYGPIFQNSISVDFLTKQQKRLVNTNLDAIEEDDETIEENWQCIKIDNFVKLIDIIDFDEFGISNYYTEIECE